MLKPRIIDAVIDTDGTEEVREVAEGTRMVSEETARKTLQVMEAVVYQSGAKGAQINGYRVAGKTGTAENVGEGSSTYDGWTTSFVGLLPPRTPASSYRLLCTARKPRHRLLAWQIPQPSLQKLWRKPCTSIMCPAPQRSRRRPLNSLRDMTKTAKVDPISTRATTRTLT